jgi:actin-related protein
MSYNAPNDNTVVIDPGSHTMRFGIGGDDKPITEFRTMVGSPKYEKMMYSKDNANNYIGSLMTNEIKNVLKMRYPLKYGIVNNWSDMERIFEYGFDRINEYTKDYDSVIVSEPCLNNILYRDRIKEILFEKFNIPKCLFVYQGVLALYGAGKLDGLVVDIGHTVAQITPVYQGYIIDRGIARFDVSGSDISEYLQRLLELEGLKLKLDTVDTIKHRMSTFYNTECLEYELPDGTPITVNAIDLSREFIDPMFSPTLIGKDVVGIHNLIIDCVTKCSIDTRKIMYNNIILTGGSSNLFGFNDRLNVELDKLNVNINTIHYTDTRITWLGGSILSCLDNIQWMVYDT